MGVFRSVSSANFWVDRRKVEASAGVAVEGERDVIIGIGRYADFGARGTSWLNLVRVWVSRVGEVTRK